MNCKLCNSMNTKIIYKGKIRDGHVGNYTSSDVEMYQCEDCKTIWHIDGINHVDYYESKNYRDSLEGTTDIKDFYKMHDIENAEKFRYIGIDGLRGKKVADVGCGGGAFLDYLYSVVDEIIAIEPSQIYRKELKKKGYKTYAYAFEAIKEYGGNIDLVTSFDVIEHVEDPIQFIKEIYDLLSPNGVAYIGTPTDAPVMRKLLKETYDSFLFSTQHPWVLSEGSFDYIIKKLRLKDIEYSVKFYQRYGLSNLLYWLENKKPGKNYEYDFVSNEINAVWKSNLERQKMSDYIVLHIHKL